MERLKQQHSKNLKETVTLFLICVSVGFLSLFFFNQNTYAVPATGQLESARATASQARQKLDKIAVKLELATEDYEEARSAVAATKASILDTTNDLEKAQKELEGIQVKLNNRAEAMYRSDHTNMIDVVLGADDFSDFVTRLDMVQRLAQQDNELLYDLRATQTKIQSAKTRLEEKRNEQEQAQRKFEQKKVEAEALFAEQNQYLQSLTSKIKELIVAERKQIAAEEKRKAAQRAREQAQAQAQTRPTQAASTQKTSTVVVAGARSFNASSLGGAHSSAANIARRFVGKTPYLWGGTSPRGFDCSGLTQYCYKEIGIDIPRTSRDQYRIGAFIPANRTDLLQPGDLLFFGYNRNASQIHHVGIYAGGGQMIHAPQTGMNVSVTYLSSRSDFVGAVRP